MLYPIIIENFLLPAVNLLTETDFWNRSIRMRQLERQSSELIQRQQLQSLRKILRFAYDHVPFYRERFDQSGLAPDDINGLEDLQRFPVTTRMDMDANFPDRITAQKTSGNHRLVATSGTTSQRMIALQDFAKRDTVRAASVHSFKFCGLRMGSRSVEIPPDICNVQCGVNREPEPPLHRYVRRLNYQKLKDRKTWSDIRGMIERQVIQRQMVISSFGADGVNQNDEVCAKYLSLIRSYRPEVIKALPAYLLILARFIQSKGLTPPYAREIRPMGAALAPSARRIIETAFQCKVIEDYGCAELGAIGCECSPGNGMHLFSDLFYLEFVRNGSHVGPGEVGRVLVTDLTNRIMPFIRYDIGDLGYRVTDSCNCGRNSDKFKVLGRVRDVLVTKSGRIFTEHDLSDFFYTYPGVAWYQVTELLGDRLDVKIVADADAQLDTAVLIDDLNSYLDENRRITLRQTKSITPENGGKFRFVKANNSNFDATGKIA